MEVQQCMKLTVTNSSIDFFVPIDYVHLHQPQTRSVCGVMKINCSVLTRQRRCGRRAPQGATDYRPVWVARSSLSKAPCGQVTERRVIKTKSGNATQLLENNLCCCVLPTWWLLRGGCTRSHSEHGRETPQRQWYSVLRRGRVGRCQVCKTQLINIFSTQKQTAKRPVKGRSQRGLLCYKAQRQKQSGVPTNVRPLQETNRLRQFAPAQIRHRKAMT